MALKIKMKNKTTGQTENAAYARIVKVSGNTERVLCRVEFYASQAMASNKKARMGAKMYRLDFNEASTKNFIAECYTQLKEKHADFRNAEDV